MTFGSLFAGIGGLDLGFERAGMTCAWQVEIDQYCRKVLEKHWPRVRRWDGVRTFPPEGDWSVDLICGGFPCQDISNAGKRAGIDGERSGLWSEFARVVRVLRPRYVVVENVAAILGRGVDRVLGDLAALGFDAEWECLPAAAFGAPHIRWRMFIVAYARGEHGGTRRQRGLAGDCARDAEPTHGTEVLRDTDSGRCAGDDWRQYVQLSQNGREDVPHANGTRLALRQGVSGDDGTQRATIERSDWWAVEPDVGRVAHGVPFELDCIRGLTNEAEYDSEADPEDNRAVVWRFLRSVWEHRELAAASSREYRRRVLDCVPEMPHGNPYAGWDVGSRIEKDEGLRRLWNDFYSQPFQEAQDLQRCLLERIRSEKRPQALASRVDRLRGLGNAVVPQVAEWIGRRIMVVSAGEPTQVAR